MYHIEGKIEGIAPILFNAPSLNMLEPDGGARQKTDATRDQEALKKCYRNGKGLYLPSWNFKKCLLDGFKVLDLRVPGNKNQRLWRYVQSVIFVEPAELPFGIEEPNYEMGNGCVKGLHKHPGRNSDGSATIVRRPALATGWQLPFGFSVLDDLAREGDIRSALQTAGERVGLGGWRPGSPKGGEYGRFEIIEWKTIGT